MTVLPDNLTGNPVCVNRCSNVRRLPVSVAVIRLLALPLWHIYAYIMPQIAPCWDDS